MNNIPVIGHGKTNAQPQFDDKVKRFKEQAIERILTKARNIAYEPKTKHIVFAILDDLVDTEMLSRALMAHVQALQGQVNNLTADLEALRRAQNNDAKV